MLWILLAGLLSLNVIEAQEAPLNSVKTERGANDPMAHQYLSKTRKWMNASKALEAYFMVCMGQDERSAFLNCQPGSILLSGEKYRLLMGGEEYYCDAKNIWTYSQSTQEASVYQYNKSQANLNPFLLIRNYEKYYRAKYIRQESIEGSMRNIIDLIPLEASEFLKIRIFLNESADWEFAPITGSRNSAPLPRRVQKLARYTDPKDACSACYGSLIHALNRLSEAGKLRAGLPPVCIGQGFQGQSGEIGVGKCTSCFAKSLHGCPPKAIDIVKFLEENWTQAPDKEIKNS